jgi:hypothetical protein
LYLKNAVLQTGIFSKGTPVSRPDLMVNDERAELEFGDP